MMNHLFSGAFYLYAALSAVGALYFYLVLPETRGLTLEDMEQQFSGSWLIPKKKSHQQQ